MKNGWVSVYLYNDLKFEDVIVKLVDTLVIDLTNSRHLKSFFFIRYWENGDHIRLRTLLRNEDSSLAVETIIVTHATSFFKSQKNCTQYRIEFVPYNREIVRYLGDNGMKISERLFEYSSKTVIAIIKKYYSTWNNGIAIAFAIKMHVIFAKKVTGNHEVIASIFKAISDNWMIHSVKKNDLGHATVDNIEKVMAAFEKTYYEQKERVVSIVESALALTEDDTEGEQWEVKWSGYCQIISNQVNRKNGIVPGNIAQFCDSHMHMTNNRLGVYLRDESFIAFMLYKIFSE